ncbi:MAG: DUF4956 domain-containing protein [Gemmataceae bacterium]|nr:DUF4956 domain-containing protein [Gemmataceae bacterium]
MVDPSFPSVVVSSHDVSALAAAGRLGTAFAFGVVIALIHRLFRWGDDRPGGLGTTLILLCVIVALVTVAIGESTARAFGLVGALSIVRFRTTVGDTRDTAFVIFSVAVGMSIGAGYLTAAAVAVPIIAAACGLIELFARNHGRAGRIKLKVATVEEGEAAMKQLIPLGVLRSRIHQGGSARKSQAMELTYTVWLAPKASPAAILEKLRQCPGVQKSAWQSR